MMRTRLLRGGESSNECESESMTITRQALRCSSSLVKLHEGQLRCRRAIASWRPLKTPIVCWDIASAKRLILQWFRGRMRIAQIVAPDASQYERKSQRIDAALLGERVGDV